MESALTDKTNETMLILCQTQDHDTPDNRNTNYGINEGKEGYLERIKYH